MARFPFCFSVKENDAYLLYDIECEIDVQHEHGNGLVASDVYINDMNLFDPLASTFAKQLGRAHAQVKSIADMLKSGIHKPTRKRLYGLAWGPQYDKEAKIKRWAATSAGQKPGRVAWHFFEFAERLLKNQISLTDLRGRRGEAMPKEADWQRMTSFLQYEGFGETVLRQAGEDAETDPDKVIASWGSPRLIASVEGVRFYGH